MHNKKEISDNNKLIGLSKEEVVQLLGEAYKKDGGKDGEIYEYDVGKISDMLFMGESDFYKFVVFFDKNGKVKSTSINMVP